MGRRRPFRGDLCRGKGRRAPGQRCLRAGEGRAKSKCCEPAVSGLTAPRRSRRDLLPVPLLRRSRLQAPLSAADCLGRHHRRLGRSDHAIFALHEFLTDKRPEDQSSENGRDLELFGEVVLGCPLPRTKSPWCVRVPDAPGTTAQLYVAHLTTDLRAKTLEFLGKRTDLSRSMTE
jgi:hypothetical protein